MKKFLWVFAVMCLFAIPVFAQEADKESQGSKVFPKKAEVDKNRDGKIDHVEYFENGKVARTEEDTNFDGTMDEVTYFENGKPVKSERDSDHDGKPDTWITF